jgi:hypothetical protein
MSEKPSPETQKRCLFRDLGLLGWCAIAFGFVMLLPGLAPLFAFDWVIEKPWHWRVGLWIFLVSFISFVVLTHLWTLRILELLVSATSSVSTTSNVSETPNVTATSDHSAT